MAPRRAWGASDHDFDAALGEITLAVLAARDSTPASELDTLLAVIAREVGWRATDTGVPPAEGDISWAWHQTTNLLRALTLHHRATGPRSTPWG